MNPCSCGTKPRAINLFNDIVCINTICINNNNGLNRSSVLTVRVAESQARLRPVTFMKIRPGRPVA